MGIYPNLLEEMARTGIPASEIAKEIGVNPATLSAKMNDANRLKLAEAAKIRNRFSQGLQWTIFFRRFR